MGGGNSKTKVAPHQGASTAEAIKYNLDALGLGQYAKAFIDLGYDDIELLQDMSQDELLIIAKRVNMLEGHAAKWVKAVSGSACPMSKVTAAFSATMPAKGSSFVGGADDDLAETSEKFAARGGKGDAGANEDAVAEARARVDADKPMFYFIKAEKLRKCDDAVLPRMQDLRRQRPDWFVEKEISLEGACAHEYVNKVLSVSHRWERPGEPDVQGVQFAAIKK